ncbi:MAG: thiamine-phosphate kinase [Myxococcota bacterium]
MGVHSRMATLGEVGEHALLDYLKRRLGAASDGVRVGVGDDAAVLENLGPAAVITTDSLVEWTHFDLQYMSWSDVGHKAAASNLSDLAAMGATPRGLLLALTLRARDTFGEFVELIDGFVELARKYGAALIGGDISKTEGPMVVGVTAIGAQHPDRVVRRSFGQRGDLIVTTGAFGGSAAGLFLLRQGRRHPAALIKRHVRPQPQLRIASRLAEASLVRSGADTSDGLARDVMLLPRPGLGACVDVNKIPMAQDIRPIAEEMGVAPWELALGGGEDFELALAVDPDRLAEVRVLGGEARVRLSVIGEVVERPGLQLIGAPAGYSGSGFDHFRG